MKHVFGALATLGGLTVCAALGLMLYGIIQKGVSTPDMFDLKLLAMGGIAYIVGQLAFFALGGKVKTRS